MLGLPCSCACTALVVTFIHCIPAHFFVMLAASRCAGCPLQWEGGGIRSLRVQELSIQYQGGGGVLAGIFPSVSSCRQAPAESLPSRMLSTNNAISFDASM